MQAQGLDPAKPCPKGVRLGVSGRRLRRRPPAQRGEPRGVGCAAVEAPGGASGPAIAKQGCTDTPST